MTKHDKLKQALEMTKALKNKTEAWVLLAKMDRLEDKFDNIKSPEVKDEEIEITLDIV
jgi:hypothetical protein